MSKEARLFRNCFSNGIETLEMKYFMCFGICCANSDNWWWRFSCSEEYQTKEIQEMFCNSNQTTKEIWAMVCSCSSDGNPTNGNSDDLLHLFQQWKSAAINARLQQWQSANENCNSFERKNLQSDSLRKIELCQHQSPTKEMPFSYASSSWPYLCDQLNKSKFWTSVASRLASLLLPPWHFLTSSLNSTFRNHIVPA